MDLTHQTPLSMIYMYVCMYMCSPSWTLLPPPSPFHPSGSSQCTSPKHPVSCIKPGLATRFIHDILYVSMPFSQIFPPSPSLEAFLLNKWTILKVAYSLNYLVKKEENPFPAGTDSLFLDPGLAVGSSWVLDSCTGQRGQREPSWKVPPRGPGWSQKAWVMNEAT